MAKFLADNELNSELEKLFLNAEEEIIIISPYIKLHPRYVAALNKHKENPSIHFTLIFGKNKEDISKSMKYEDLNFFMNFPNIEIRYEERLHAKYYSNEFTSILTSMNLYSYSQDINIEFGVMTTRSFIVKKDGLDYSAWEYFNRVIENSNLLFEKVTEQEKTFGIKKKYKEPEIRTDILSNFFGNKSIPSQTKIIKNKRLNVSENNTEKSRHKGFCIRTGKEIPFNIEKPMSYEAFKSWSKYGDRDYSENYCHYSGESSHGKTSVNKPILNKNWRQAIKYT